METDLLAVAASAAADLANPLRLMFLSLGVVIGLILGVIPGMGGLVGLSLLLPFTYGMDIVTALAFLLGLSAVVVTSDTIPAVLFRVPGSVGSAATILDGYPMAQQGRAAEAFGAAFSASVIGGVFGAVLLAVSIPIMRPVMLSIATPELLAICIFGLSLVAVLSGNSPLKGIIACCIGLAFTTIGDDSQTATLRWTFNTLYLYDGIPIIPVALGLFATPQMAELAIMRRNISSDSRPAGRWAQIEGVKSSFKNIFLIFRCSGIGALLGAIPGIGAPVIDWIAYAHAKRTEKGADKSFGKGDVRGVIASESSNNAKEGGALIPTIVFGVPGSASMAILLGAFLIHGIVPGPEMLTENLDITYVMVWSIVLANILGAGICFLFANQLARVAQIPTGILVPIVLSFVFVGAFQSSGQWGDIYLLLGFGVLGFVMKQLGWPRPPLMLGFVLGGLLERYSFISISRYGAEWVLRPMVLTMLVLTAVGILYPLLRNLIAGKKNRKQPRVFRFRRDQLDAELIFIIALFAIFTAVFTTSSSWDWAARIFPQSVALISIAGLLAYTGIKLYATRTTDDLIPAPSTDQERVSSGFPTRRLFTFSLWCLLFFVAASLLGFLVSLFLVTLFYIRYEGRESWRLASLVSGTLFLLSYILFHLALRMDWPHSIIGNIFPDLRAIMWTGIF